MRFEDEIQTNTQCVSNKLLLLTIPKHNECLGKDDRETQENKTKAENISKDICDLRVDSLSENYSCKIRNEFS